MGFIPFALQKLVTVSRTLKNTDKGRITQVIGNLLSNALKFTNEGDISVSVKSKDYQVVISVNDNGQGVDPDI